MNYTTDRADAAQKARAALARSDLVILDTETTALDGYLVQVAVINTAGDVLLDTLVNPCAAISAGAQAVHGLKTEQLLGAPAFATVEPQLAAAIHGKRVVVYNAAFDRGILYNELERFYREKLNDDPAWVYRAAAAWLKRCNWRCAMDLYSQWVGEWSSYHGSYRWQKLPGGDHSALGDARACLAVLRRMAGSEEA